MNANNIDESHGLGHSEDTVGWALPTAVDPHHNFLKKLKIL